MNHKTNMSPMVSCSQVQPESVRSQGTVEFTLWGYINLVCRQGSIKWFCKYHAAHGQLNMNSMIKKKESFTQVVHIYYSSDILTELSKQFWYLKYVWIKNIQICLCNRSRKSIAFMLYKSDFHKTSSHYSDRHLYRA